MRYENPKLAAELDAIFARMPDVDCALWLAERLSGGWANAGQELTDLIADADTVPLTDALYAYVGFEPDYADIRACNIGDYQADLQREARA